MSLWAQDAPWSTPVSTKHLQHLSVNGRMLLTFMKNVEINGLKSVITFIGCEISESVGLNLWLILSSVTGWLWWVAWQLLYKFHSSVERQSKNFWVVSLRFIEPPNIVFLKSHHQEIKKKPSLSNAEMLLRKWRMFCEREIFYSDLQAECLNFCLLLLSLWKHK